MQEEYFRSSSYVKKKKRKKSKKRLLTEEPRGKQMYSCRNSKFTPESYCQDQDNCLVFSKDRNSFKPLVCPSFISCLHFLSAAA